jgi:FixJ family two-component response regulator
MRRALARSLRAAGFQVEAFASAEALIARGLPEGDACLVLDVSMPGIGGIEFRRALIADRRDLPTIFITARPKEEVGPELDSLGAVAVLYKPFAERTLLAAIERAGEPKREG